VLGAWTAELVYICVLGAAFFWRFRGGAWKSVRI